MARDIYNIALHSEVLCNIARGINPTSLKDYEEDKKPIYNSISILEKKDLIELTLHERSRHIGSRKIYSIIPENIIKDIENLIFSKVGFDPSLLPIKMKFSNKFEPVACSLYLDEFLSYTNNMKIGLRTLYQEFLVFYFNRFMNKAKKIYYQDKQRFQNIEKRAIEFFETEETPYDFLFFLKAMFFVTTKCKIEFIN